MSDKPVIELMQKEIDDSLKKVKCPILSKKFNIPKLDEFAITHCMRLQLDPDKACRRIRDVWWAIASVQFSLGYMIVAKNSAGSPRGSVREFIPYIEDLQVDFNISDLHFWHHANLSVECLYRVWERLASLLRFFANLPDGDNRYFSGVVNALKADASFNGLSSLKTVSRNIKNWEKVAGERNSLSHEGSRLFGKSVETAERLSVLGSSGEPLFKIAIRTPSLISVINEIKTRFICCGKAFEYVMKFINELPAPTGVELTTVEYSSSLPDLRQKSV